MRLQPHPLSMQRFWLLNVFVCEIGVFIFYHFYMYKWPKLTVGGLCSLEITCVIISPHKFTIHYDAQRFSHRNSICWSLATHNWPTTTREYVVAVISSTNLHLTNRITDVHSKLRWPHLRVWRLWDYPTVCLWPIQIQTYRSLVVDRRIFLRCLYA